MRSSHIIAAVAVAFLGFAGCKSATQADQPKAPVLSSFNGNEAFSFLVQQCDFGPRKPGTAAHEKCLQYIVQNLKPYANTVKLQPFTFRDDARDITLHLTNIAAVFNPNAKRKVMLFTHWDTRPTADEELDPGPRSQPIPGADDGASGTAVLLELARVLHQTPPTVGVVLLFVDGEDWGPDDDKMYLGAKYFAAHPGDLRPDYAILLDMIGKKNLSIQREMTSEEVHPELDKKVWDTAAALGYTTQFAPGSRWRISDDHDSFNAAGIPAIDLIDFNYADWHKLSDTPDKCSPDSLKAVGDVMAQVIADEH